jgi:rhodanese-related sulfurtransferase
MFPEITVTDLSEKLKSQELFILLDVREPHELGYAKITDSRLEVAPLSRLAREGTKALSESAASPESTIYVLCHHGNRSSQVTAWLTQQGWKTSSMCVAGSMNTRGGWINLSGSISDLVNDIKK